MAFCGERFPGSNLEAEWKSEREKRHESLPSDDPRDYFVDTLLAKHAAEIDPDISRNWNNLRQLEVSRDELGSTAFGLSYAPDGQSSLYLADKTKGEAPLSVELVEVGDVGFGLAGQCERQAALYFPGDAYHQFVRRLPEVLRATKEMPLADRTVAMAEAFLEALPRRYDGQNVGELSITTTHRHGDATKEQVEALQSIVKKLSYLVAPEVLQAKVAEFNEELSSAMNPFAKYFDGVVMDMAKWAVGENSEFPQNFGRQNSKEAVVSYKVKSLTTRRPKTAEEFTAVLQAEPCEELPRYKQVGQEHAEFVRVENIVGAYDTSSWDAINTAEKRGVPKIMELAQRMMNGAVDKDPIKLVKIDGKYYVSSDGRHRTAAMKALGVKGEIPALVMEAEVEK